MFWLNLVAFPNICDIFVTLLVFQVFQLGLMRVAGSPTLLASRNILERSIVAGVVKLGASLAVTCMLLHPQKAPFILVQAMVPHCLIWVSFNLSPPLLKKMRGKLPLILMS